MFNNLIYFNNFNTFYYKIYKKYIYNKIKSYIKISKKYKFKYKLNLLNYFYSYTFSYINKYISKYIYKIKYINNYRILKNNKLNTIILYYKKTFIKKKQKKNMKYNIIIGSGSYKAWIGIGIDKNISYRKTCLKASINSKKCIYNLNFIPNDYKIFKYKNYKFSILNKSANKYNLSIYNNIIFLTGLKKLKLISYTNTTSKNILRALLHYFN